MTRYFMDIVEWPLIEDNDRGSVMDTTSEPECDYKPDISDDICVTVDCANNDCSQQFHICNENQYRQYCIYDGCCSIDCYTWVHSQDIDLLCTEMMQIKC